MDKKVCCITGHRNIEANKLDFVREQTHGEIAKAIAEGYTHFISGFAEGIDLLFASLLIQFMEQDPTLTLEAAIPYRKRMQTTDPLFWQLISKCKIIGVHSEEYTPFCFQLRNRSMVSQSQRVIAVYDGRKKGGTLYTMRYAHLLNKELCVIQI